MIGGFCGNNHITDGVEESSCPVQGLNWINRSVSRVCDGTVFGPFVLQLSELSGTHRSCHRGCILHVRQLEVFCAHALIDPPGSES